MQARPIASPRRQHGRGFTLVELMLVVLLIGILAAIALPRYNDYRNRIRVAQAVTEIGALSALARTYWQDARAYPNSLADIGRAGAKDPWGRPYVYYNIDANGKGHARKDKALNPINTDFDLYSPGTDGETKKQISNRDSLDDVIRANSGAFIGLAADF